MLYGMDDEDDDVLVVLVVCSGCVVDGRMLVVVYEAMNCSAVLNHSMYDTDSDSDAKFLRSLLWVMIWISMVMMMMIGMELRMTA
jgi:hypothetical protein